MAASISTYLYSFHDIVKHIAKYPDKSILTEHTGIVVTAGNVLLLSLGLLASAIFKPAKPIQSILLCMIAANLAAIVLLPYFVSFFEIVFIANLIFILMTVLLFIASFTYEDRRIFWAAVLMAALLILTRTLEYDTELLIKAAIFIAGGIGIIVAGVLFERFLRARRLTHA